MLARHSSHGRRVVWLLILSAGFVGMACAVRSYQMYVAEYWARAAIGGAAVPVSLKPINQTLSRIIYASAVFLSAVTVTFLWRFLRTERNRPGSFVASIKLWRLMIWMVATVPAILLFLHRPGLLPFGWERRPIAEIAHDGDFAYSTHLTTAWMSQHESATPATVLENGIPLGPTGVLHVNVRHTGHGLANFWYDVLVFSTSDNTDPRTNGRSYEVFWPMPLPSFVYWITFIFAALVNLVALIWWGWLRLLVTTPMPFILSAAIITVPFLLTRLPFFLYYTIPLFTPDSDSYFGPLIEWSRGTWPSFGSRTPGYPLFMNAIFALNDRIMAVIVAQTLLTLTACLSVAYAVYRRSALLAPWAALAMAAFVSANSSVEYDTAVMSDSPFSSCVIFACAFLMIALYEEWYISFFLCSFFMGITILLRPAGVFFIPIYFMVLAFLGWNRFAWKKLMLFAVPMPAFIFSLCFYNYLTIHVFSICPLGNVALAITTSPYWETNSKYPPEVNKKIEAILKRMDPKDRELIFNSWSLESLYGAFGRSFYQDVDLAAEKGCSENCRLLKEVSLDAIMSHKDLYAKYVLTELRMHYFRLLSLEWAYYEYRVPGRYCVLYSASDLTDPSYRPYLLKEFHNAPPPRDFVRIKEPGSTWASVREYPISRLHRLIILIHSFLFKNIVWPFAFFMVFIVCLLKVLRSRFRNRDAFLLLSVTGASVAYALTICCIAQTHNRYTYPMEFEYYLPVALLPLLFMRGKERINRSQ